MQRILIIDDEECIRETLGTFSEMLGYKPILAADPKLCNALHPDNEQCQRDQPCADILLVDQGLPGISGLRFIERQIRKGCRVPTHRKALMSGALTEHEHRQALKMGCHVLQKPVTLQVLQDWLADLDSKVV